MQYRNVVFVGESHSIALAKALVRRGGSDRSITVVDVRQHRPFVSAGPKGLTLSPGLADELAALNAPDTAFVSCIGGNQHNILGLIANPRPFDFYLSDHPDLLVDPAVELISEGALETTLEARMTNEIFTVEQFRAIIGRRIYHTESPPPLADEAHIIAKADTLFKNGHIENFGVAPRALRRKLWLLQSRILHRRFAAADIGFIPLPPQVFDDEGLLHRDGYGRDATHANEWFGEIVLSQAQELLLAGEPAAAQA